MARRLADDLAVVSLTHDLRKRRLTGVFYVVDFWKQRGGTWQIVARYSSPVGHKVDRGNRPLPPPADVDPELTGVLSALDEQLGQGALGGFKDTATMERVVASEFTQRVSDAPQRSLPRAMWGQPSGSTRLSRWSSATTPLASWPMISRHSVFCSTQKASRDGQDQSGDFYVVDVGRKRGERWQVIARYSSPLGRTFDRR